mgnify:CR=1 FL=1
MNNIREVIARQQREIREQFGVLAKLYPGCFDKSGKPIVVELRLPAQGKGGE